MKINELNPYVKRYMKNRGFSDPEAVCRYLSFDEENLRKVQDMCGGAELLNALFEAVREGCRITVYGDYDADGVMATFILYTGLERLLPGRVNWFINDRFSDGYTITPESMEKMLSLYPETEVVVTCDNGISAPAAIRHAAERGVLVLVTDHHGQTEELPADCPVVDEKSFAQREKDAADGVKSEDFCGAELARRVVTELYEKLEKAEENRAFLDGLFAYSGFATITDSVPMTAANHYVARRGLELIREGSGVWGLLNEICGVRRGAVNDDTVGFKYGPMVNASGRVTGRADSALEVFLQFHYGREEDCRKAVDTLLSLNDDRRAMCLEDDALAFRLAKESGAEDMPFILLADPRFREGINGLTAAHLVEKYKVPAAVLSPVGNGSGRYKGSARSVEGFDLFAALASHSDFVQAGGHPMAAGLSVKEEDIDRLRAALMEDAAGIKGTGGAEDAGSEEAEIPQKKPLKPADFTFVPSDLTVKTVDELEEAARILRPFGPGLEPMRVALECEAPRLYPKKGKDGTPTHARFSMDRWSKDLHEVSAVWWNHLEEAAALTEAAGGGYRFVGRLEINAYRDVKIQMVIDEAERI